MMPTESFFVDLAMHKLRTGHGPSLAEIATVMDAQGLDSGLVRKLNHGWWGSYIQFSDALSSLLQVLWVALTGWLRR